MGTNDDRAMAQFEAGISPEEHALGAAFAEGFDFAREILVLRTALGADFGIRRSAAPRHAAGDSLSTAARAQRPKTRRQPQSSRASRADPQRRRFPESGGTPDAAARGDALTF